MELIDTDFLTFKQPLYCHSTQQDQFFYSLSQISNNTFIGIGHQSAIVHWLHSNFSVSRRRGSYHQWAKLTSYTWKNLAPVIAYTLPDPNQSSKNLTNSVIVRYSIRYSAIRNSACLGGRIP